MANNFNRLFLSALIITSSQSCTEVDNIQVKRYQTINEAVDAIRNLDTLKLFSLMDTARNFEIYGRENLIHKVNLASTRFSKCEIDDFKQAMSSKQIAGNFQEYIIPFCRSAGKVIQNESFDLILVFADFENFDRIVFFDTKFYTRNNMPLLP